jgi:hypothetical protein
MKHWIDKQDRDDKKIGKRIDRILINIKKLIDEDCLEIKHRKSVQQLYNSFDELRSSYIKAKISF